MKDIKISLNNIWYTYTVLIPTNLMFPLLNATFDSNLLVEQMIKKYWGRMHALSLNVLGDIKT